MTLTPSFDSEFAVQTDLARRQFVEAQSSGDDSLVQAAAARLADLEDLRALHGADAVVTGPLATPLAVPAA